MSVAATLERPATDTTKGYFGMQGNSTCLDCGTVLEQPVRGRRRVRCPGCQRIDRNRRRTAQRFCQYCSRPIPLGSRAAAFCPEHRTYRSRHPERPAKELSPLVCPTCGVTFAKRKRKPTTRYCSKSCANKETSKARGWQPKPPSVAVITARAIAREMTEPVEIMCPLNWRACVDCGIEWLANYGVGSKRCGPCQLVHKKREAIRTALGAYYAKTAHLGARGARHCVCSVCGKEFTARTVSTLCSRRCANRTPGAILTKARRRGAEGAGERFSSYEIYERDGFMCHICGKALRMDKAGPHPLSPSIDHLLPIADGGPHTRLNTKAAHFICNAKRGNRGAAQLAMV